MFYDKLTEKLLPFLTEQGYTQTENGFVNGEKTVRFVYNEAQKIYELYLKEAETEKKLSAYLFDETQTEKDIEAVAIDFTDTLKTAFGIKRKANNANNIELPNELGGERVGIGGLTQKLLAFFPQYKETYKVHVAKYGKLLMTDFCREYFIPSAKELLNSANKRQIKKFYDAMCDIFIAADSETVPYVVGIVAAAVYGDQQKLETLKAQTENCTSFYVQVLNFTAKIKHSKKLRESLCK